VYELDLFDEDNDVAGASMQGPRVEEDVDHERHGGGEQEEGGKDTQIF
jgi:hypothetical protein